MKIKSAKYPSKARSSYLPPFAVNKDNPKKGRDYPFLSNCSNKGDAGGCSDWVVPSVMELTGDEERRAECFMG
jgi:hypothetical protein